MVSLLRIMRLLRVLRLVRFVRSLYPLYKVCVGCAAAFQSMLWVLVVAAVVVYAGGVALTRLVGHEKLYGEHIPVEARNPLVQCLTQCSYSFG